MSSSASSPNPPSSLLPVMSVNVDYWDGIGWSSDDNDNAQISDNTTMGSEGPTSAETPYGDQAQKGFVSRKDSQETIRPPRYPHMPQKNPIIPPLLYHLWATTDRWRNTWWRVPRSMRHLFIPPLLPRQENMFPGTQRLDDPREELEAEFKQDLGTFIDRLINNPSLLLGNGSLKDMRKAMKKSDPLEQPGMLPKNGWVSAGPRIPRPECVQTPLRDIVVENRAAELEHDEKWFQKQQRRLRKSACRDRHRTTDVAS